MEKVDEEGKIIGFSILKEGALKPIGEGACCYPENEGEQKISWLADQGYIARKDLVPVGQILGRSQADIEDIFDPHDYLNLYNGAFGKKLTASVLNGDDPIVKQIARAKGIDNFDHGKPADLLLRNRDAIFPNLKQETIDNFDSLFNRLNSILASFGKT